MTKAIQFLQNIYACEFTKKDKLNKYYFKTQTKKPEWTKLNVRTWFYCKGG